MPDLRIVVCVVVGRLHVSDLVSESVPATQKETFYEVIDRPLGARAEITVVSMNDCECVACALGKVFLNTTPP